MADGAPKKPWYLVAALMGALALGADGGCEGQGIVGIYRADYIDPSSLAQEISDNADREAMRAALEGYIDALGAAKGRAFPLAIAAMLVGLTTVLFAMRAMGGSAGARRGLMQLVLVQAGLVGVTFFAERDLRAASFRYASAEIRARLHQELRDPARAEQAIRFNVTKAQFRAPVRLAVTTLGSLLIVLALTRRGARAFFDASQDAVPEQ